MSWLRSRWTVVALVPAFFLAGFAIVSALAGGSDDREPSAAQKAATDAGAATGTAGGETTADEADPGASPTDGGSATSPEERGLAEGSATIDAPPAPAPGAVDVDYGSWDGMFVLGSPEIVLDFGMASVVGELRYLGGVACAVGLVRVRAWLFNASGVAVGTTVWESIQSTGEGGEVTGREPLPFEAVGQISEVPESAFVRFTAVECL